MWFVQHWLAWVPLHLLCNYAVSKNIPTFAGPFVAFAHRFDVCPSDGSIVLHLKNTHFNRARRFEKQSIWGNITFKMPYDDSLWANGNLAVWANNEWKENAFILNFPFGGCSTAREHVPCMIDVFAKFVPELSNKKAPCRVPPGEYTIENQTISWEFPKFKNMPYGRYRLTLTIGKTTRTKRFCLEVDCEVIPKVS